MYNPQASFRNILHPVKAEDFFATDFCRKVRYIQGPVDKFEGLFDWVDLNRFLNFYKTWDSHNVKMVLDGEPVPPSEYCPNGQMDRAILSKFLDQGATLVLIRFETLSDGACAIYKSIQIATGGLCGGNLYYSRKGHAGFKPHFDTRGVIIIQIAGEKNWNIYGTQFENPMMKQGFHTMSFTHEYHKKNKGAIEAEITMTPGDVLYIPPGKYHSALAKSEASLHLTFGIEPAYGYDYLQSLIETMPNDPLFRAYIPHYDNVKAHEAYLTKLADKLYEKMTDPETMKQMRDEQRRRAHENLPIFNLPHCSRQSGFRVRVTGSKLVRRGNKWRLTTPLGKSEISAETAPVVSWMLLSDLFTIENLKNSFADMDEFQLSKIISILTKAGLIEEV